MSRRAVSTARVDIRGVRGLRETASGLFGNLKMLVSARRAGAGAADSSMSTTRRLPSVLFALLVTVPMWQCLSPVTECDLFTCDGCCDAKAQCHHLAQADPLNCGSGGQQCVACASGLVCTSGQCTPIGGWKDAGPSDGGNPDGSLPGVDAGCDQCPNRGATQCDPNQPDTVDICRRVNGCLQWTPRFQCPPGSACSQGQCSGANPDAGCTNGCPNFGAQQCDPNNPGNFQFCIQRNGCLEWSRSIPCPPGTTCDQGQCVGSSDAGCASNCPNLGARQCDPASPGAFDVCVPFGGCLVWSPPLNCFNGGTCVNGQCQAPGPDSGFCQNPCPFQGFQQCTSSNGGEVCMPDPSGCLSWQQFVCSSTETCNNGQCVASVDAGPVPVGASCAANTDCANGFCITPWPNGYCTTQCSSQSPCPGSATCVSDPTGNGVCLAGCNSPWQGQDVCRSGYLCYGNPTTLDGGVCGPNCHLIPTCGPTSTCTDAGYCQ